MLSNAMTKLYTKQRPAEHSSARYRSEPERAPATLLRLQGTLESSKIWNVALETGAGSYGGRST